MDVMNTKDTHLLLRNAGMDEALGVMLFGKLYQEASAYAECGRDGLKLRLFDSSFASEVLAREWTSNTRIALYVNHPEGDMKPREQDLRNLALMPEGTKMYIVCEGTCVRWKN